MVQPVTRSTSPSKNVLAVDDSRIALRFLEFRLQGMGYQVVATQSAATALDHLASTPFSMVFLDVVLGPDAVMDGLALCRHIKQKLDHPGSRPPAVVMVTGLAASIDRVRGNLAGCDAYLTKPLMEDEFVKAVRSLSLA